MRDAYVYYRVAPAHAALAANRVDTLLQALASHCTHLPRRLVRCDDAMTWMEIYEGIVDWTAFTAAMQRAVHTLQIDACLNGERHLECFATPAGPA